MSAVVPGTTGAMELERQALDAWLGSVADAELAAASGALQAPLRYILAGGGKRLRGVLCILAYRALGGRDVAICDVASALELVHAYSLVHDDLPCMDNDDLRRGRPTVHRVFGSARAATAGAALLPLAFRLLLRGTAGLGLESGRSGAVILTLARAGGAGGMAGGQWQDLEAEGRPLELEELARMHAAKTGALFQAAVAMGGICAGGGDDQVAALAGFGAGLGLAFQVVDDLLDENADASVLGKTPGKDRRQDKATYPALLGAEVARGRARAALDQGVTRLRAAGIATEELEAVGEWVLARDH